MRELFADNDLLNAFRATRTIAVLGAHPDVERPAHFVPDYLHRHGYIIIPVNPAFYGATLWGQSIQKSLTDIHQPVDMVDVFRRSTVLREHLNEILGMRPHPPFVWFQQGIRNEEVAESLIRAGIQVIQDRCTMAEHRRLGMPKPGSLHGH